MDSINELEELQENIDMSRTDEAYKLFVANKLRYHEDLLRSHTSLLEEVADILRGAKMFFRLANGFGRFVKWIGMIAAGVVAVVQAYRMFK